MGLFGHGGKLSEVGHKIGHTLDHYDQVLRSHGAPDIYIGGTYSNGQFTPAAPIQGYSSPAGNPKPNAYTANAAKTASSIKQGGMTKDEVQEFNMKHPNETAWRQE